MSIDFASTIIDVVRDVTDGKVLLTLFILVVSLLVKRGLLTLIKKRSRRKGQDRRNVLTILDQLGNGLIFLLVILIWANEIQSIAISIAAFMVAIVLATKEFIQCFIGFIYYLGARPFRIGEWVELNTVMGEVVDMDWANSALLEVNPDTFVYTGKHVYIPNSQLVTQTIRNLNFMRRYRLHSFEIVNEPCISPYPLLPMFTQIAEKHCEYFKDVAERYKGLIERHLDQEFISTRPEVEVKTNSLAKVVINVSLFCPTEEAYHLEQKLTQEWMSLWYQSAEQINSVLSLPNVNRSVAVSSAQ